MAAALFYLPFPVAFSSNGLPEAGAKLYFYLTGTTTPAATYTTDALSTAHSHPVVANGAGRLPQVYLDDSVTYRLIIKDADDNTLDDVDPYIPGVSSAVITAAPGTAVSSRAALAAIASPVNEQVALFDGSVWEFSTADHSANVTKDSLQAVYVAPSADTDGSSGAWVRQYHGALNLKWFGAEEGQDIAAALQAVVTFVGTNLGGECYIPKGNYLLNSTVDWYATIKLVGAGSSPFAQFYSGTMITVASGVTGFLLTNEATNYPTGCIFDGISFKAAGRNTNSTTGSMTAGTNTLTLASASDFQNGDIICVRGAGASQTLMSADFLKGSTSSGSPTITTNINHGAYVGMVLNCGGAFPASSYVTAVTATTITMSANATSTVSLQTITYRHDIHAMILSGGGTTTLTLSSYCSSDGNVSAVPVIHYDSAIYSFARFSLYNCAAIGFQGAGAVMLGGAAYDQPSIYASNSNCAYWHNYNALLCRSAMVIGGTDGNASLFNSMVFSSCDEYCILDYSFLNNTYVGPHVSGVRGMMTCVSASGVVFVGDYTEGGTINSFAANTTGISGIGSTKDMGGCRMRPRSGLLEMPPMWFTAQSDTRYQATVGSRAAGFGLINFDASSAGGSGSYNFFIYEDRMWKFTDSSGAKMTIGFSDTGLAATTTHAGGGGHVFLPRGVCIGNDTTGTVYDATKFRRVLYGGAAPTSGVFNRGDQILNNSVSAGGTPGWATTTGGTAGSTAVFKDMASVAA